MRVPPTHACYYPACTAGATYDSATGTVLKTKGASSEATSAVTAALKVGYRMIDTAQMYKNEEEIGSALAENGSISRDSVFLVTKLHGDKHGKEACQTALKRSLELLQVRHFLFTII